MAMRSVLQIEDAMAMSIQSHKCYGNIGGADVCGSGSGSASGYGSGVWAWCGKL